MELTSTGRSVLVSGRCVSRRPKIAALPAPACPSPLDAREGTTAGKIETQPSPDGGLLERGVLLLEIEERRRGREALPRPSLFCVMRLEYHEPLRLRIGQWFDYESVDIAEDRRICPDAEGEGERGDDGESRRLRQHPKPVANILQQRFDEGHAARIAMFLFSF